MEQFEIHISCLEQLNKSHYFGNIIFVTSSLYHSIVAATLCPKTFSARLKARENSVALHADTRNVYDFSENVFVRHRCCARGKTSQH